MKTKKEIQKELDALDGQLKSINGEDLYRAIGALHALRWVLATQKFPISFHLDKARERKLARGDSQPGGAA